MSKELNHDVLRLFRAGGPRDQRTLCPQCSHTRKPANRKVPVLSITDEGTRLVFNCQHCGYSGYTWKQEMTENPPQRAVEPFSPPPARVVAFTPPEPSSDLLSQTEGYFMHRGISPETWASVGVVPGTWKQRPAMFFPYKDGAYKVRGLEEKWFSQVNVCNSFFMQPETLSSDSLIIVEGEGDSLSFLEAGVLDAMSVPNGAPQKVSENRVDASEDRKFSYVWGAKHLYDQAKKIYIATDGDAPGQALAEELARRIGKARCWRVTYPDGCKDANDVLRAHGAEAVRDLLTKAEPWPIQGIYDAKHYEDKVKSIYNGGLAKGISTGFPSLDDYYTVVPGHLVVVTGVPGSGKSSFLNQILVNLADRLDWKFAIQSTEIDPPVHIAMLAAIYTGIPFFDDFNVTRMDVVQLDKALDWVNDHFTFLESDGPANVKGTIERLENAVMRYGVRGVCIDPASYLRGEGGDSMSTEQVGFMLEEFKSFAKTHDCVTWLIAHPFKIRQNQDGTAPVPKGYDISGSAGWYNRADMGLTVHRPADDRTKTELYVWKVRFGHTGKEGMTDFFYDVPTGRYSENPFPRAPGQVVYSMLGNSVKPAFDAFSTEHGGGKIDALSSPEPWEN